MAKKKNNNNNSNNEKDTRVATDGWIDDSEKESERERKDINIHRERERGPLTRISCYMASERERETHTRLYIDL